MVKIGRNIVLGWMISLLGFARGSPAAMMIMALVLASSSTWEGESGAGLLVSAAGPDAGAVSDAWREDGDKGAAAAAAAAAAATESVVHVYVGEDGVRDGAESETGGDNAIRPPQQRRRGRRLEPEVGVADGAGDGEEGIQYATNAEEANKWGVPLEVMPKGSTAEDIEKLVRQRNYLNGLVDDTAAKTRQQACNVAFAKTHKTASTTMAMILVRYARRHNKKLASFGGRYVSEIPLKEAMHQIKDSGERVDVMHYHYSSSGTFEGRWEQATSMYEQIMQEGERISYVTVLRDQRSHFLSYYYYFVQPEVQLSVEHFFGSERKDQGFQRQRKRLQNPLCSEFGIRDREQLQHFIDKELPDFRLVLLTEEFDEGLMVLRRLMGWEMIDMTYERMMETKAGGRRWDGKELKNVPHWQELPQWVQDRIDESTNLDKILYDAAADHYREMKAVAAVEIEADLKEFEELQHVVEEYLRKNGSSEAVRWYSGRAEPYKGGEKFAPF